MAKQVVHTKHAPEAIGPYSQGIIFEAGKMIYTAGQIPMHPITGMIPGDIQTQTAQALENLKAVLEAGGSGLDHVVKTTVFLKDMGEFPKMNRVYETYFGQNPPARSAIEAARLPKDVKIEIECLALVP